MRAAYVVSPLAVAVLAAFFASAPRTVHAVPQLPHTAYGAVTVGGAPATDGEPVEARVGSTNYAVSAISGATPRTANGSYGTNGAEDFQIIAADSDTGLGGAHNGDGLAFWVGGLRASIQVVSNPTDTSECPSVVFPAVGSTVDTYPFCVGGISHLDLSVVPPTPTATPASTPPSPPSSGGSGGFGGLLGAPTATPTSTPTPTVSVSPVLELSDLTVSPVEVDSGEAVTISFLVYETAQAPANGIPVAVSLAGQEDHRVSITLGPGAATMISTTVSRTVPGPYEVTVGVEGDSHVLVGQFSVRAPLPPPTPTPASSVTGTLTGVQKTSILTEEQSASARDDLNKALGIATTSADAVVVPMGDVTVVSAGPEKIRATIPVTGLTADSQLAGEVHLSLGSMTVDAVDGAGIGEIRIGAGLTVHGQVALIPLEGALGIEFDQPALAFQPLAPSAALLTGGDEDVTQLAATFDVGVKQLPDGAQLGVAYAKEPSVFVPDTGAVFALVAEQVASGASVAASTDVAFAVHVTKQNITNDDLGGNTVTLTVSSAWVQKREAVGKGIVIGKVDDKGNVFSLPASCVIQGDSANCTVTFTGEAGGFSVFMLVAVQPAPPSVTLTPTPTIAPASTPPPIATPTPTVPPLPTATPTPTSTPTRTPTPLPTVRPTATAATSPPLGSGGGAGLIIIVGVVSVAVVGGAGAFLVLRGVGP